MSWNGQRGLESRGEPGREPPLSYLRTAHDIRNFFVLAPNLTIYDKPITDFTPNTSKYVFKGIAEFATEAPDIVTGDNYEAIAGSLLDQPDRCKVNIFSISKINSEVRGGKSPRIKRLSEYIGQSCFEYLAGFDDLVLIMTESHRYLASAGVKAINELRPVIDSSKSGAEEDEMVQQLSGTDDTGHGRSRR